MLEAFQTRHYATYMQVNENLSEECALRLGSPDQGRSDGVILSFLNAVVTSRIAKLSRELYSSVENLAAMLGSQNQWFRQSPFSVRLRHSGFNKYRHLSL
ncbi:predicted protein [Sclerotinia sclerotiorum 1980 UF-70]|uniref:Uncharacterized protein n=1 Tax=Sclerotinia sclerotiorum (strain ATCC 18683 / 1980 / Ss-1) TaxID=665079 RepID=A7EGI6_SCLS1|nr:predicted protein [Sclerotinia sclerotiorum 1980 UF-70]EDO01952.1 predicted protein [Sclerotinia sclerotiorum 1980 UF-70]